MRRVVITGMGMVSPCGNSLNESWQNLINGKSGISLITHFDATDFPARIAGEVRNLNPEDFVDKKDAKRLDPFLIYALAAAKMAMEDSGLAIEEEFSERVGVMVGAGMGGLQTIEKYHKACMEGGPRKISPFFIPYSIVNMAPGLISIEYGAKGPNLSIVTACATSTHCIGEAFECILRGDADVMITGGAEGTITPLAIGGFCSMKALSTRNDEPEKASRPFDRDRDGFVMGEGGAILILEELEFAKKRGAKIYAEVVGYGLSGDANHMTAPDPQGDGAYRCMKMAVNDAGISPDEIDYINAHGTSTYYNDLYETMAIKRLFGERAYKIPVSSTKSMTGHLLGAAGAVEAAITAMAIKEEVVPPTINYESKDEGCDLDYVPNEARKVKLRYAMSNSFGFGGTNAAIVLKKFE
ncbi:MAG: beta-ketoacyl-ACP synthase II [bacterium]